MFKLYIRVVLRHILAGRSHRRKTGELIDPDSDSDDEAKPVEINGIKNKNCKRTACSNGSELLDFDGPKLISGCRRWLLLYQLIGQINWSNKPLYLSIIYKMFILTFTLYTVWSRFICSYYNNNTSEGKFRNPIFIFIWCLSVITIVIQMLHTIYVGLFNLCPLFKILTTPRLCFIREETLKDLGDRTCTSALLFYFIITTVGSLILTKDPEGFIVNFSIMGFLCEFFGICIICYHITGICFIDFYVRSAFGHWLMALKSHLEIRFTREHLRQRRLRRSGASSNQALSICSSQSLSSLKIVEQDDAKWQDKSPASFDEIQRYLNNMDDHLEVLRSIQVGTLVGISLLTFVGNGTIFLLVYNLIANQKNYYHGLLFFYLGISGIILTFVSYFGDRWIFYALSSFVQTVEDEYFMQNNPNELAENLDPSLDRPDDGKRVSHRDQINIEDTSSKATSGNKSFIIRKKDVLFCREFLHQFENHLATPWSKLTFKSHLHILRTFVTLMAAQIIFDLEH